MSCGEMLFHHISNRFSADSTALNWFKSYQTDRTQIYSRGQPDAQLLGRLQRSPGSVFGPLGFASYTEDVADLMDRHNVQFHLYTDDTQFLDCCQSTDTASLRARLSNSPSVHPTSSSPAAQCQQDRGHLVRLQAKPSQTQQH